MASTQEELQCMLWYKESKSVVTVQRNFMHVNQKDAKTDRCIHMWYQQFQETGSVLKTTFTR
jgi:hypothetical protein